MQSGEAILVAEIRTHVIGQQVAYWWERNNDTRVLIKCSFKKNNKNFIYKVAKNSEILWKKDIELNGWKTKSMAFHIINRVQGVVRADA